MISATAWNPENPYVANEWYFANITTRHFEDTKFALVHKLNLMASTVCGTFGTILLFFVILKKTPAHCREFCKLMYISVVVDLYFLLAQFLFQPRCRIDNSVYLYTFRGPISALSHEAQCYAYGLRTMAPYLTVVVLPVIFYVRLYPIKYKIVPTAGHLVGYCAAAFAAVGVVGIVAPFNYCPAPDPQAPDYGSLWYPEVPVPHLLVMNIERDYLAFLTVIYTRVLIFGSYALAIFFAVLSVRELQRNASDFSPKTLNLQHQFSRMLFMQSLLPLFIVIPSILTTILLFAKLDFEYMADLVLMPVTWTPAINAISTLYLIQPYKRAVKGFFVKLEKTSDVFSVAADSRTHPTVHFI